eukprot:1157228-Pelagomonas_calceolata.AAC.2
MPLPLLHLRLPAAAAAALGQNRLAQVPAHNRCTCITSSKDAQFKMCTAQSRHSSRHAVDHPNLHQHLSWRLLTACLAGRTPTASKKVCRMKQEKGKAACCFLAGVVLALLPLMGTSAAQCL